jgi:hypothetical protein
MFLARVHSVKFETRSLASTETLNALLLLAIGVGAGCAGKSEAQGGAGSSGSSPAGGNGMPTAGEAGSSAGNPSGGATAGGTDNAGGAVGGSNIGGTGTGGGASVGRTCENPQPHLAEATGWILCTGNFYHAPSWETAVSPDRRAMRSATRTASTARATQTARIFRMDAVGRRRLPEA